MNKEDKLKIYKRCVDTWGRELQINMLFEELGELITAVSRYIRGRGDHLDILEEVFDVNILIEQLKYIISNDLKKNGISISIEDLNNILKTIEKEKLERLETRLEIVRRTGK